MINVLSIDLDVCFPAIDLWPNRHWKSGSNPIEIWDDYFLEHPSLRESCVCELTTFRSIINAVDNAVSKGIPIQFGVDHDEIVHTLPIDELYITNIDHHDDFLSGLFIEKGMNKSEKYIAEKKELELIKSLDNFNEGNWGAWLCTKGFLRRFIWISSGNSTVFEKRAPQIKKLIKEENFSCQFYFSKLNEFKMTEHKFDCVFICLSPQYLPKPFWSLLGFLQRRILKNQQHAELCSIIELNADRTFPYRDTVLKEALK